MQTQSTPSSVSEVKRLRDAIERALADEESGTGWGPDVTVCAYLREALKPGPHNSASLEARVTALSNMAKAKPDATTKALSNFVEAIEAYGETGVWPDNYTLRKLADEGRVALKAANDKADRPPTQRDEQH